MKPYNFAANFSSTVFCSSAGRFSHDEWPLRLAFFPISFTACLNSLASFSSSTAAARRQHWMWNACSWTFPCLVAPSTPKPNRMVVGGPLDKHDRCKQRERREDLVRDDRKVTQVGRLATSRYSDEYCGANFVRKQFLSCDWWTIGGRKQVGICLAFRRKLAFGSMNEEDDLCTDFQIYVTTMDQYHQNSLRTSRVECILESMLASIHVAILHAHDVSRSYFHGGSF